MTVREVASRVGYRQPAQFAKAFRRHHGDSPSDFRTTRRFSRAVDGNGNGNGSHDGATPTLRPMRGVISPLSPRYAY
jgi:AraC-like DNA-binding protein